MSYENRYMLCGAMVALAVGCGGDKTAPVPTVQVPQASPAVTAPVANASPAAVPSPAPVATAPVVSATNSAVPAQVPQVANRPKGERVDPVILPDDDPNTGGPAIR